MLASFSPTFTENLYPPLNHLILPKGWLSYLRRSFWSTSFSFFIERGL